MATSNVFRSVLSFQSRFKIKAIARLFLSLALALSLNFQAEAVVLKPGNLKTEPEIQKLVSQPLFWKRPELWRKLVNERKVLVSVTHPDVWSFKGAGIVEVPRSFAVEKAKDFSRLSKISDHFSEIRFDSRNSLLQMKIKLLGKERSLNLLLMEEKLDRESRIEFVSQGPWLEGLKGVFLFKDLGRQSTEVGLLAQYAGEIGWIPNWLFTWTAEGVMHHVAEQLRNDLESDYKK